MNARRMEIARRLVACPKWVWLPGMLCYGRLHTSALKTVEATAPMRIASVTDDGVFVETSIFTRGGRVVRTLALFEPTFPDLDDELTRTGGVLAVVRRACGHLACVESPAVSGLLRLSTNPAPWRVHFRGGIAVGDTEEDALLSVLESAS